jgi:hypothetical protein
VFLGVGPPGLFGVHAGVRSVSARGVRVMRRLLVMSRSVMFGGFAVVLRGLGMMFGRLGVMVRSFLRHGFLSSTRMTYGS